MTQAGGPGHSPDGATAPDDATAAGNGDHANRTRKAALLQWRVQLAPDHPGRNLTDYDVEVIANSPAVEPAMIARIPMVSSKQLLRQLADELAHVLRTGEMPAPDGPPESAESSGHLAALPFARLDLTRPANVEAPLPINPTVAGSGLRLEWPPARAGARVTIYRLISAASVQSPPEYGEPVAATYGLQAHDGRPFASAVRYYQVWVHAGTDDDAAAAAQPRLHAVGAVVAPVQDCEIVVDETVVVGRWRSVPGTSRVEVHRLAPGGAYNPANRLPSDEHAEGFRDATGRPGQTYQYDVYAMSDVDDAETQSAAVSRVVEIPARLEPVPDLQVRVYDRGGQTLFDLAWTPPVDGQVRIYRTQREPSPGLQDETRRLDAIEREGLDDDALVKHPSRTDGGHAAIYEVPWPAGWPRAHFTPVTVAGALGRVGPSVAKVRAGRVRDAILVERVDYQIAVFSWPAGAASVAAYVTAPGAPLADPAAHRPGAEISREAYSRDGGLVLHLRGEAVDVHLVSKIWDLGAPDYGAPVVLRYPGLRRIAYQLAPAPAVAEDRGLFRRRSSQPQQVATHLLRLVADRDLASTPPLAIVHNDRRMPLSPYDGKFVAQVPQVPLARDLYTDVASLDLRGCRGGFVRLFVTDPDTDVTTAVIDPDVEMLRRP